MVPSLAEKAVGFHAESGAGKTPLARTIAMAVPRYWITKAQEQGEMVASFYQACEFYFFRGQLGPSFDQTSSMTELSVRNNSKILKFRAFTDVGSVESMSKERWALLSG